MTSLWQSQAAHHLLALREILVRHDENWKANLLMEQCVPYVCADRRDVQRAHEDQTAMVQHAIDAAIGKEYYDNNPGDRPFEEQYGLASAAQIFDGLPRFRIALDVLMERGDESPRVLDLACNDGVFAQALHEIGSGFHYAGLDLSQVCIDRALARDLPDTRFECGSILDASSLFFAPGMHDLVVMFEVLEHVLHPEKFLQAAWGMINAGGALLVSTPNGAVEQGELPRWDVVEPKGHIWAFTAQEFHDMLADLGAGEPVLTLGPDGVLVGQVTR